MCSPNSDCLLGTAPKPKEVMRNGTLLQMHQDGPGEDGGVALSTTWTYPPAHPFLSLTQALDKVKAACDPVDGLRRGSLFNPECVSHAPC